ncbi:MAG: bacteriohemerythrin [Gammaproteobacteria bacterium]|nr:bacteriohemerythrin [Gammaproteobacteria bacterium]NNF61270.1 hemerythrin family protein [Gammaproteobacteria bacterium]NNM21698.1 hemerythrin family protein [Gammaproteobacteria bacterium]
MTLIEWKKEYSVGVASIDQEHQELIELINDIYTRMRDPLSVATIDYHLGEISSNIAAHFALEERVMREARYDELDAHKEDHEKLLDEIHDLIDRFAADPESGRELLQERLSDWFANHFATFDARLHKKLGV